MVLALRTPEENRKSVRCRTLFVVWFICRSDRGKNGHCPIVEQIRPLPHSGCLAHQNAALIQPDIGDLALVDLHQPQAGGGLLNTCDVGAAVQGTVVVCILALLAHKLCLALWI